MSQPPKRHPLNCEGPFFVADGDCMGCGAPELYAGDLMSHDESGSCYFVRQPVTDEETNAAILGLWASCCGAVHYGGADPDILIRLDQLKNPFKARDRVYFEYPSPGGVLSRRCHLRDIANFLAGGLAEPSSSFSVETSVLWTRASLVVKWGHSLKEGPFSVVVTLHYLDTDSWMVRISGNPVSHTSFAIHIDEILRHRTEVRNIRWANGSESGRTWPRPL